MPHPLLSLIHFPNVVGPETFAGVDRYAARRGRTIFKRRYQRELALALAVTAFFLWRDLWTGLLFLVVPQLWGARSILRINLIQHGGTDPSSADHSRSFVGRAFNFIMMNNGYHAIHHDRPGLHWSELAAAHQPGTLDEPSMLRYLVRAFVRGRA
jgi:fatty acid desaturase